MGYLSAGGQVINRISVAYCVSAGYIGIQSPLRIPETLCRAYRVRQLLIPEIQIGFDKLAMPCGIMCPVLQLHIPMEKMIPRHVIVVKAPNAVAEMGRIISEHFAFPEIAVQIPKIFKVIIVQRDIAPAPEISPVPLMRGIDLLPCGGGSFYIAFNGGESLLLSFCRDDRNINPERESLFIFIANNSGMRIYPGGFRSLKPLRPNTDAKSALTH